MSNEIENKLTKLIEGLKPGFIYDDKLNLVEDLNLDSLDVIGFLFEVEQEFDIKIPEEDIDSNNLFHIGSLYNYIDKKKS